MTDKPNFVSRIGQWFRGLRPSDDRLPLESQPAEPAGEHASSERRLSFWRPFARRDAAIASLQQGFGTLTELMSTIRDNLERQGRRQDELLAHLATLPELLETLPESQRLQAEAIRAIEQQLQQQIAQQERLGEILERMSDSGDQQRQHVEALSSRVESMSQQEQAVADNLRDVGSAMQSMGRSAESSAAVLQQLQQGISARNSEIEQTLQRQNSRVTILLIVASAVSLAALIAVIVVGSLLLTR